MSIPPPCPPQGYKKEKANPPPSSPLRYSVISKGPKPLVPKGKDPIYIGFGKSDLDSRKAIPQVRDHVSLAVVNQLRWTPNIQFSAVAH